MLIKDYILDNLTISGSRKGKDEIFVNSIVKKGDDCHTNLYLKLKQILNLITFSLTLKDACEVL